MTQPLTPFYPIFAGKSDGHDVVNQKGVPVRNGPTAEQLDRTPNDQGQCDYYRLIEKDDPKHIDWRKKLGGMLLRQIGGKAHEDKWQQCVLWDFPDNYRLYEHIKTKADGHSKTVKNHSGGGHDRQDAYLYGYPKGPRKRFRSPVEFFPHLLWLATDDTSDYQNCTCKMCSPVQLDLKMEEVEEVKDSRESRELRGASNATTATTATTNPITNTNANTAAPAVRPPSRNSPVIVPRRLSNAPAASPITAPSTPVLPAKAPAPAPMTLQSTPLPDPRNMDQQVDHQYNRFLCRTGEVVWYYRPKTNAWGLGLVLRRWSPRHSPADRSYLIQPLSHPFDSPATELVTSEQHLKPWLAWSAPTCTYAYLQQNPALTYEQVDWQTLLSGRYGSGIADVDASILAAKAIDSTYTLFELLKKTPSNGTQDRYYNGMYLGAEKFWRGEAVRLRIGSGTDVMVVSEIVERVPNPPTNQPAKVHVLGDIYSYATLPAPDPTNPPPVPHQNPNIPMRMREDMAWRNRTLIPHTHTLAYWKLIAPLSRLDISELKGRWYETSLVFEEPFKKAVANNEGGNGIWMNSRGDATGIGKATGVPRADRLVAFGRSIPKNIATVDGIEPPPEQIQEMDMHHMHNAAAAAAVAAAAAGGNPNAHAQGGGDAFAEFFDIESMGDSSGMANTYDLHF